MDNDLISREAARRAVRKLYTKEVISEDSAYNMAIDQADDVIRHLPSAERTGRWIFNQNFAEPPFKCSVCGKSQGRLSKYCPDCGATMEVV